MPKVGNKSFGYKPTDVARARKFANATNQPMRTDQSDNQGGANVAGNYRGGVAPINPGNRPNMNPNQGAVNNFMNQNAVGNLTDRGNMNPNKQDVSRLQNGLNYLNRARPDYTELKVDGVMGPKTRGTADKYLGRNLRA